VESEHNELVNTVIILFAYGQQYLNWRKIDSLHCCENFNSLLGDQCMGKVFETITDDLQAFIAQQHLFFVSTAPLGEEGHINLSPKGMDSFRVLSDHEVAYVDLTGSGNETSAHIQENGRITFMFCAFEGAPKVLRLYGHGRVVLPTDTEWESLSSHFTLYPGTRQIIAAEISRVSTACGYAVPLYEFKEQRDTLVKWAEHKGHEGLDAYRQQKNLCSIDELPTPLGVREL
jgi:hypothetical protein